MNTLHACLAILAIAIGTVSTQGTTKASCTTSAQKCLKDMDDAYTQTNFTKVCSLLDKSGSCYAALEKKCPTEHKLFDNAQIQLTDQEMKVGCGGSCGKKAEACLSDLAEEMNKKNVTYNLAICKTVTKALKCLEDLKSTDCTSADKKTLTFISKYTKRSQFSDLCDDQGNPSKCFKGLNECYKGIKGTDPNTPTDQACNKIEIFLECQSKLACTGSLKEYKAKINNELETTETMYKCPTTGTCDERMSRCANTTGNAIADFTTDVDHIAEVCKSVKVGIRCFDIVRKDPVCILSKASVADYEQKARDLYNGGCAVSGTCAGRMGHCANVTSSTLSRYQTDRKYIYEICNDIKVGINCFDVVRKSTSCASQAATIENYETEAKNMYNGLCTVRGTCKAKMEYCSNTTSTALDSYKTDKTNLYDICQAIQAGVKCFEVARKNDVCASQAKIVQRYEAEANGLYKGECAVLGKCGESMNECGKNTSDALDKFQTDKGNKDEVCKDVQKGIDCFDKVRKDPKCASQAKTIGGYEDKAKTLYKAECGGASSVIISTALVTMGLAISIFKNYF